MKINYSDHYRPKKDEIDNAYGDALFIFDTNSLLDLYRINPSVTEKALKTIEKYKHRIYITPHTDEEYHRHHYEITAEMCLTVKEIVTHLSPDPFISKLEEIIKKNSKYNCQFPSDLQKAYISKIENTIRKIREELSELQSHFNNVFTTHQLQHRISDLFNGRVLPNLPEQRIREIIETDGPKRYYDKTPPGYMDAGKATANNDNNTFGDLIIWFEILDYVKNNPNNIFFICRDEKEDWISKVDEMIIGPRMELLVEFQKYAPGKIFHIIKLTDFLEKLGKDEEFSEDELGSIPTSAFDQTSHIHLFEEDYQSKEKRKRFSLENPFDGVTDSASVEQPSNLKMPSHGLFKRVRTKKTDHPTHLPPPPFDNNTLDS